MMNKNPPCNTAFNPVPVSKEVKRPNTMNIELAIYRTTYNTPEEEKCF